MAVPATASGNQAPFAGWLRGVVVAKNTGAPVPGAIVTLPGYRVRTRSGSDGSFSFVPALPTNAPYRRIEAVVTAPGFGQWTITGVPLRPNDTLILRAELGNAPFTDTVLTPAERAVQTLAFSQPEGTTGYTCTGWDDQLVPTPTIRVYRTKTKVPERYGFLFYVMHVLPNEWLPEWDADSLGAGAVAAKTYAGYRAMSGHAYSGGANCADITDWTNDQVFDPSWEAASTDQAVFDTFGSILWRNGGLFLSQYWAGSPGDPCAPVKNGQFAGRMSQWGTVTCANKGMLWPDIDRTFYENTIWHYLNNLFLNPSMESPAIGRWRHTTGTVISRISTDHYDGAWALSLKASTPGAFATLYQYRNFLGTNKNTYHLSMALKCLRVNGTACRIVLKVIAVPKSGSLVIRSLVVNERDDNAWRLYSFDPTASGIAHVFVQVNVVTKQQIHVDRGFLRGQFGGP